MIRESLTLSMCFFLSVGASEAATLSYDDAGRALSISDLDVDGQTYQITFNVEAYKTAYPLGRIFSNAAQISDAIVGVLEAETIIPLIGVNGLPHDPDRVQAGIGFTLPSSPTSTFTARCPSYVYGGADPLINDGYGFGQGHPLTDGGECADGYNETFTQSHSLWESEALWAIVTGGTFEGGGPTSPPPPPSPVPLPASLPLLAVAIMGLGFLRRKQRQH